MQNGNFEITETKILIKLFSQADVFVNVGANFGYYICIARNMGLRSIAIEPVPINQRILKQNIIENNWDQNVILHPIACGNSDGNITIYGEGTGASIIPGWAQNPSTLKHVVPMKKLDNILSNEKVTSKSVILIDVEGFEFDVLLGAENILRSQDKPVIMLESGLTDHRSEGDLNLKFIEIFKFIIKNGYRVFSVEDINFEITQELIKKNIEQNEDQLGTHNFLLIPNGFDFSILR
ncbi:FkbM family methyltransferase [Amylibacter sp.]|jgi:FkbM family methyltransferase|nr:FkbM family methyltransferase [Amylibacter sp.]MDA9927263.1 FkbM family methyltransferase [Amylibacter sp.]MDB9754627.1 FkbM family methyltransferase [Amylibacter sp.]|tara:strand:- start:267 stop:974 length:708 start_codon:yes stop_codon:yes gene_type:complete